MGPQQLGAWNSRRVNKFRAVKVVLEGITFDSKAEAEMYQLQKADPAVKHIDVHPTLTLPGGIRYKPDFLIWKNDSAARPTVIEVKGVVTQDFRRMRKLFDHCLPNFLPGIHPISLNGIHSISTNGIHPISKTGATRSDSDGC